MRPELGRAVPVLPRRRGGGSASSGRCCISHAPAALRWMRPEAALDERLTRPYGAGRIARLHLAGHPPNPRDRGGIGGLVGAYLGEPALRLGLRLDAQFGVERSCRARTRRRPRHDGRRAWRRTRQRGRLPERIGRDEPLDEPGRLVEVTPGLLQSGALHGRPASRAVVPLAGWRPSPRTRPPEQAVAVELDRPRATPGTAGDLVAGRPPSASRWGGRKIADGGIRPSSAGSPGWWEALRVAARAPVEVGHRGVHDLFAAQAVARREGEGEADQAAGHAGTRPRGDQPIVDPDPETAEHVKSGNHHAAPKAIPIRTNERSHTDQRDHPRGPDPATAGGTALTMGNVGP